jgi:hypothetical protein
MTFTGPVDSLYYRATTEVYRRLKIKQNVKSIHIDIKLIATFYASSMYCDVNLRGTVKSMILELFVPNDPRRSSPPVDTH